MTDNEIIKALGCCAELKCHECPYEPKEWKQGSFGCMCEIQGIALDLINRQKAEIERLSQSILIADNIKISKEEFIEKLRNARIQILPREKQYELRDCPFLPFDEYCTGHCANCENRLECVDCSKRLKVKAYKEIIGKLKEHLCNYDLPDYHSFRAVDEDTIDEVLKELVGEQQ